MTRDWEKELAKIDKQLESLSDDELLPKPAPVVAPGKGGPSAAKAAAPAPKPAAPAKALPGGTRAPAPAGAAGTTTLGVTLRLLLAAGVAVGVLFWPYEARCGTGLAGYLGAVAVVALAGAWSAVWTWRHRAPKSHLVALTLVGWGVALAAAEVLPRIGYAQPDPARTVWVCE